MKPPHGIQAFHGTPPVTGRPAATPARVVQVGPPATTTPPKRTHLTEPLLSVRLPNRVTLSAELVKQVNDALRGPGETLQNQRTRFGLASPVELVPAARNLSGVWYLDVRATAGRRLPKTPGSRYEFATSHHLAPGHFSRPMAIGQPHQMRSRLSFRLGEQVVPGYFALVAM
ncbi:hypothetical protein [Hymenobacter mucosus]|uniref:Uncharacterized protein n=1 Tax=Hymenobacter mucosus TaxID=1411120 RepID=A0A239A8S5_9BACT|nr:hypothetical protein [Hymenobacter mucosus]SNR92017.1 hypothetical protein SAMN06269173_11169 [Hymenobacter mucosus]